MEPRKIKWFIVGLITLALIVALPFFIVPRVNSGPKLPGPETSDRLFDVQAIDTMKYSRDRAREALDRPDFNREIDEEITLIKETGATHVAIGTPYDEEFLPVLSRWVESARKHGLSVWFRGNFSGWEGWFEYPAMNQKDHEDKLSAFIKGHPELFADGDLFSPCPECENGTEGDPRKTGDAKSFNAFLRKEHDIATDSFRSIHKDVRVVHSMNADIARDVLDSNTRRAIDGSILVDHYVKTPEAFLVDIHDMRELLGDQTGIGEFGAPIPDLQGNLNEDDQSGFIQKILNGLYGDEKRISIINYWTLKGGTTALVEEGGRKKESYSTIHDYFSPITVSGVVTDSNNKGLKGAIITVPGTNYVRQTDDSGAYRILIPRSLTKIVFSKDGYDSSTMETENTEDGVSKDVILESTHASQKSRTQTSSQE